MTLHRFGFLTALLVLLSSAVAQEPVEIDIKAVAGRPVARSELVCGRFDTIATKR